MSFPVFADMFCFVDDDDGLISGTNRYFLITPKLLANLTYHPRMKVHTINSGDWVQEGHSMDVMKYIKLAKEWSVGA